jgi:hypothetical protein
MNYAFTIANPPLLKDFGAAVLVLPESELSNTVGESKWMSVYHQDNVGYTIYVSEFTLTRIMYWVAVPPLVHYAVNTNVTNRVVVGYEKSQESTFAQNLGVEAGGKFFDALSFDVKASLNITEGMKEQWKEEHTTEENMTYEGGHDYLTWKLIDSLRLHHITTITGKGWNTHRVGDNSTTLNSTITVHNDVQETAKAATMKEIARA